MGFPGAASWLLAAAAIAGTVYQAASAVLVRRLVAHTPAPPAESPPVTLLKPLCGDEPWLEANLRSFCEQRYPDVQIVFGVHTGDDPALAVAERLRRELPQADISVVVGRGRPRDGNPKVANLIDMLPAARHDILVLSDSDMAVGPDFLSAVVATLQEPGVGVATSLYVGRPAGGIWSRLGAMGINHGFLPAVAVATAIGRDDGCFGATIALRRDTLAAVGGLESLREQLADDYLLGAAVRAHGRSIGLVPYLPRSAVHEADAASLFAHEVRWGRTLGSIDGAGYAASLVTLAVPMGVLALAAGWAAGSAGESGGAVAGALSLVAALLGRLWAVRSEERSLELERQPAWLVMARDLLSFAVQAVALSGRTVSWRGRRFRIGRHGVLIPLGESPRP